MKIAICDDETEDLKIIQSYLSIILQYRQACFKAVKPYLKPIKVASTT